MTQPDRMDLGPVADRVLQSLAGPDARLREDQRTAVAALLQPGARVLVVQATGWGKSAVYWVATGLRRAAGAGPTLVISPLLSLMRDQVVAAERAGLRTATLNSSNVSQWSQIENALLADDLDVLLISPERLANPGFGQRVLTTLAPRLGLLVVDEAHAISDWGHDFRPDYRRVALALHRLAPSTPVLATTATANARVRQDVADQLGAETLVLRGPLARASLQLSVINDLTPLQRFAWVVENLPRLNGSGIVYALTVSDAMRLAEAVQHVHGPELPVAAYTGQLDGDTRQLLEERLRANELKALIATSALGMGYDKPDLGFCVHVGAPPSPVSYYQQVGRAGRGIDHASVVLLASGADAGVWDYFATASIPKPAEVTALLQVLPGPGQSPASVPALEAESGLRRSKVDLLLKQLAVDGVTERGEQGWSGTGVEWAYDAEHYDGVLATRRREADIMRDYALGRCCLMQLLQQALDDPDAAPCGRCSVCTGQLPAGLSPMPELSTTQAVGAALRSRPLVLEPRKMWPGGEFGSRGRIAPADAVDEGRVLVRADAPEWSELVAACFGSTAAAQAQHERTAPSPAAAADLAAAVVRVLSGWRTDWAERPEVVVGLPAAGYRELVDQLVREVATVGRLDETTIDLRDGPPPSRDLPSAAEAAHWQSRLNADSSEVAGRVVLLVVDRSHSGWPATVAGALLRRAGARRVLPLVVHQPA
ncbi:MAG: DEAD/DEAH box helicase [Actinomycetales bacterium]